MKLNSIIFHCAKLPKIRDFYENLLGLEVGLYEKDGQQVPDSSQSYVNYNCAGTLLCFEVAEDKIEQGTIVLTTEDIESLRQKLEKAQVPLKVSQSWIKLKDPENRNLIIEKS